MMAWQRRPLAVMQACALLVRPSMSFSIQPMRWKSKNGALQSLRSQSSDTTTATTATTATTTAMPISVSDKAALSSVCGGDFAGLWATFSATTGDLIHVPEYMIPESLLEWGQVPACLEVLVSESLPVKEDSTVLSRQTVTIFPEVGCGIDNLETKKKEEELVVFNLERVGDGNSVVETDSADRSTTTSAVSFNAPIGKDKFRVETIFPLHENEGHRLRVMIDFQCKDINTSSSSNSKSDDDENDQGVDIVMVQQSPIVVVMDRKTSNDSTGGTIADGGGLDGRTVSELMGDALNVDKSFAETDRNESAVTNDSDDNEMAFVELPGKVGVAFGQVGRSFVLKIRHPGDNIDGTTTTPTVVERQYTTESITAILNGFETA